MATSPEVSSNVRESSGGNHMPGLDGVRGIAISLVLLHHVAHFYTIPHWLEWLTGAGWCGVDLFFVLSGFLITGILLRSRGRRMGLPVFWYRRALRIFPLAYLYLLVLWLACEEHLPGWASTPNEVWTWFALYGGNLYVVLHGWPRMGSLAILWSLAIEEQFYMVWPFVTRFLPVPAIAAVATALIGFAPFVREYVATKYGGVSHLVFTLGRADALCLGALLAMACSKPRWRGAIARISQWLALPGAALAIALSGPLVTGAHWHYTVPYSFVALGFVPLVAAGIRPGRVWQVALLFKPLRWLGERSYGIYVWHYFLAPMVVAWFGVSPISGLPGALTWLACTFAVSATTYAFFERPLLRLKDVFS